MWDTPVCPRSYSRIFAAAYGAAKSPLMRKKSYSRISMRHNLQQHPGNQQVLPSDFCCCNCCHKGKESECSSNCGSRNPRIRLFQDAASCCATLKSESKTPKSIHATKKSPHGTPLILRISISRKTSEFHFLSNILNKQRFRGKRVVSQHICIIN